MMIQANVIITIILLAGVIWLQIFLSKKESKWAGLILPIINFSISILTVLMSTPLFITTYENVNGVITEVDRAEVASVGQMLIMLIWWNISTAVLLLIYFSNRQKMSRNKALEKMAIKDLE